jgi:hypothetical protein
VALSHVLPCFFILILSLLHLVIFKHPNLTHTYISLIRSLILEIFSAMDSVLHFLHISISSHLSFRFPLEKKKKIDLKILEDSME